MEDADDSAGDEEYVHVRAAGDCAPSANGASTGAADPLPPPLALVFAVRRPYAHVREDRSASVLDGPAKLRFMINSRTWRNSWMLQVILTDHGWARVPVDQRDWDLWWCAGQANTRAIRELRPTQRLNKFPKSSTLTLKAHLYYTVTAAAARHGAHHFAFIPETYVLPSELDDFDARRGTPACADAIWIVKPYAAYCGRGIFLLPNAAEVPEHVLDERAVVSRYIDRPYLIDGLKSDMRLYVLVTCWHPLIVYVYRNGLVRFATETYTLDPSSLGNRTAHITNYTLNKRSDNFKATSALGDDGKGSKWTADALRARLVADVGQQAADTVWRDIDDLLVKTCIAAEPEMLANFEKYVPPACQAQPHAAVFQLFGFDVMLDADLKPWLLEVNLDPALGTDSPLDFKVKSSMLVDTLNLLGLQGQQAEHCHAKAAPFGEADEARARLPLERLRVWRALKQADDELARSRSGGFRRLLPAADSRTYAHFFPPERELNALPFAV